jgi:phage-related protein
MKYEMVFYKDSNGKEDVYEYIRTLGLAQDKNSRIKYNKISDYIYVLKKFGCIYGEPAIKYLGDGLWE